MFVTLSNTERDATQLSSRVINSQQRLEPVPVLFLLVTCVICAVGLLIVCPALIRTASAETPAPPPGYTSLDEIKLAIVLGKIRLIDVRIPLPDTIDVTKDIEYGTGGEESLKLDLYTPKNLKRAVPGLIFVHGGAWKKGSRADYRYHCIKFAQRGYVVASISYRLTQVAPFPAAVEDAKCAVRWIRANAEKLRVDPSQIGLVGGSAGGHLALMVAYSSDVPELEGEGGHTGFSSRVQVVVDLYGPVDLTTPFVTKNEELIAFMAQKTYDDTPRQYELASPIYHITEDDPPTLIMHGTIDKVVPITQSDALARKLKDTGVPYRYDRLEGWPHTMDLAQDVNRHCRLMMIEFFDQYLPLPK